MVGLGKKVLIASSSEVYGHTKGFDPLEDVKRAAAQRWVAAVNADASYGTWQYALTKKPTEVPQLILKSAGKCE